MALDRVRVHLSERSAAIPGIAFVACTRVRHPWDLVFEEDLPEYEHFMKARRTPAFRERKRFELKCEARASRTLRRYGFCEADLWSEGERRDAAALIDGLKTTAQMKRSSLGRQHGSVDFDTWLWGDGDPDYQGELAREVERVADGDEIRRAALMRVADRLLDRLHVRAASTAEISVAEELLAGVDVEGAGAASEEGWKLRLLERAEVVAAGDEERLPVLRGVARQVAGCLARCGRWTQEVADSVPVEIQPLHMSAVKEALGALIPARLHRKLDAMVKKGKDDFGPLRGGTVLRMGDWKVNVRAEDALARGTLTEEALEGFVKTLQHVTKVLGSPIAIGSKTVGKHVGVQETPARLRRVMQNWRAVWDRDFVRRQKELVLPVAVDDRAVPRDWLCVTVRSCVPGEELGEAKQLEVDVYDSMERSSVAARVARNVDALIRGLESRSDVLPPRVHVVAVPECRVSSQRILYAFGRLLGRVVVAVDSREVVPLDPESESYLPDVSLAARALFAYFRQELGARGVRDVVELMSGGDACLGVLRKFVTVPSLLSVGVPSAGRPSCAPTSAGGAAAAGCADGLTGDAVAAGSTGGRARYAAVRAMRLATWNIAGGLTSDQAPKGYNSEDQRAGVMQEVMRWSGSFGCDVVALQECEGSGAYAELLESYEMAGAVEAKSSRGFVHVYVRRNADVTFERLELAAAEPCVAVRVHFGEVEGVARSLVVVGVHLPTGGTGGKRKGILQRALSKLGEEREKVVVLGDMNVNKDAEVVELCDDLSLKEVRYAGYSWGVPSNRFFSDSSFVGPGLRKDRVLFGSKVWVHAHLVGQVEKFYAGEKFHLSDHFGLMAYVDVGDLYASRAKQDVVAARVRRAQLLALVEQNQQKESIEVRALRQAGREGQALARQRVQERRRDDVRRAQERGAKQRRMRMDKLQASAFGSDSLFGTGVSASLAAGGQVPVAPAQVAMPSLGVVPVGGFSTTEALPLRGMPRKGNTCYVLSVAQVLLRTPGVQEWMAVHALSCGRSESTCAVCALHTTLGQMHSGFGTKRSPVEPKLAEVGERRYVGEEFGTAGQQDAVLFLLQFLDRARGVELEALRFGTWGFVQLPGMAVATHVDRLFGFVREERVRCMRCRGQVRCSYVRELALRVRPRKLQGGPMTIMEMYLDSCGPAPVQGADALWCETCATRTDHDCQSRMLTVPNVLVVHVKRNPEGVEGAERDGVGAVRTRDVVGAGRLLREPVSVEEHLSLPGGIDMELVGVVYHNGVTIDSGHYTCLCRGPAGRFWFYNDANPVQRREEEVAHIKPKEVAMVVYARRTQQWAGVVLGSDDSVGDREGAGARGSGAVGVSADAVDGGVVDLESGDGGASASRDGVGSTPKRRLTRKTSCDGATEQANSPVLRQATTPERRLKAARLRHGSPAGGCEELTMSPEPASTPRRVRTKTTLPDVPVASASHAEAVSTPRRSRTATAVGASAAASPSARDGDVGQPSPGSAGRRRVSGKTAVPDAGEQAGSSASSAVRPQSLLKRRRGGAVAGERVDLCGSVSQSQMLSEDGGDAGGDSGHPFRGGPLELDDQREFEMIIELGEAGSPCRGADAASGRAGMGTLSDGVMACESVERPREEAAARAAETRADVRARRGIGDMGAAERMVRRAAAREQLDLREARGRGCGRKGGAKGGRGK